MGSAIPEDELPETSENGLENRLFTLYRVSVYVFGLLMAVGILGGTWFGLKLVQKHDAKYRVSRQIKEDLVQRQHVRVLNPYQQARAVHFSLPYEHGADPQTLSIVAALEKQKTDSVPGGFVLAGTYRSHQIHHDVNLTLSCKDVLCHLDFELPARFLLSPRIEGSRLVRPKREFELLSHGYVFAVKDSQLVGVKPEASVQMAVFRAPETLTRYFKEDYLDAQGNRIAWKPARP